MVRERLSRKKEEEKRRLELLRYSHTLSHKLLTKEGRVVLGATIPPAVLDAFQKGSVVDRDAYWEKNAPTKNFGQQMLAWVGEGQSGMAQWVARQEDPDVVGILAELGLKGVSHEKTQKDLQEPNVAKLIDTINKDLVKVGEEEFAAEDLTDDEARSLIFYANYLSGQNKGEDARSLIDTVVLLANKESGNAEETIARLQKLEPLLRVAGDEGQHVLGALMVAKVHSFAEKDKLLAVSVDAKLSDEEAAVLEFIRRNTEYAVPNPLEANTAYNIEQTLALLEPQPTPSQPYFVKGSIPRDFAQRLSTDSLQSFASPLSFWTQKDGKNVPSQEAFAPHYTLSDDARFVHAMHLTRGESGVLALAAASAENPAEQAALFTQLGKTILRVHRENPQLLQEFLTAQTPESRTIFAEWDGASTEGVVMQKFNELQERAQGMFRDKFGISQTEPFPTQFSPEQQQFLQEVESTLGQELSAFTEQVGKNFAAYPDRLVAIQETEAPANALDQHPLDIDIPSTVAFWPERIAALQEVVATEPLSLTVQQLRQLEFLGHSVDVVKITQLLQRGEESRETILPAPVAVQEEHIEAAMPSVPQEAAQAAARMSLQEFFTQYDNVESFVGPDVLPRRQDLAILDTTHMALFSPQGEDVSHFEVTDERQNLSVYTLLPGQDGAVVPAYNTRNPFFGLLFADNSLSMHSFAQLARPENGFGQNTLLAYVLEASVTASQRQALFTNLALQITSLYKEYPELAGEVRNYFASVNTQVPFKEMEDVDRVFGTKEQFDARLADLTTKLQTNQEFGVGDFRDLGLLALPFNLQTIAQRMQLAYRSRAVTA